MKYVVFDAGPIISLSMNGLLPVLEKLKEKTDCEFIITPEVKREVIDKPIKVKKFKLEAIKVQQLLDKGVFKLSTDIVGRDEITKENNRIMKKVNSFMRSIETGEKVELLHMGEVSCIAFCNLCDCESVIVVDERTTRVLFEAPQDLQNVMERKLHTKLEIDHSVLSDLQRFKFLRSTEIMYIAYKKGVLGLGEGKDVLDAVMYGLKYRGTTISSKEIDVIKSRA